MGKIKPVREGVYMTLPNFKKSLDFVLLDKPVEIVTHVNHRKFKVVAVAISGPRTEQPFLFALAVDKGLGKYRLTILSRADWNNGPDDNLEDEWIEARKIFFNPWVKEWLANHPEQLIQAGVAIARMHKEVREVGEHWHNIYVTETVKEVINSLRRKGIEVEYTPNKSDPEEPNGYIEQAGGVISSCVRWRKNEKVIPGLSITPKQAMACLQLFSEAKNFEQVRKVTESTFNIIQDCTVC